MSEEPQQLISTKKIFYLGIGLVGFLSIFALSQVDWDMEIPSLETPSLETPSIELPKLELPQVLTGGLDCTTMSDYNHNSTQQTGWSAQCIETQDRTQNMYSMLIVILIVLAGVSVLTVVRMLA